MNLAALRCPYCEQARLAESPDSIRCESCGLHFPIVHGVVNTLIKPDGEVIRELQGMLEEAHEKSEPWQTVEELMVRRVPHVTSQQERENSLRGQPKNYYLSTRMNVDTAYRLIDLGRAKTVLEIGGENEFPFLKPLHDRGIDCYVTNIHFVYDSDDEPQPWVTKVAGDMNRLPFRDQFFDVVIMSATSHHSPDLDRTVAEMSRVTRPGGSVLVLNDPVHGVAKHLLDRFARGGKLAKGGERQELIHENEFTIGQYRRAFHKHGLRLRSSLFPAYYDEKLSSGDVKGVRWAALGKLVSMVWRVPVLKGVMKTIGLSLGQRIIGLEMNVVLEKAAI